jgi:hypothetical protein
MHRQPKTTQLEQRLDELRASLRSADPTALAARTGSQYHAGEVVKGSFSLPVWGTSVEISFPALVASQHDTGKELPLVLQAMLCYYFATSDGTPGSSRWISFSQLPDGRFYNQAFQGYTGHRLAQAFQSDEELFSQVARQQGGELFSHGDLAYAFQAFPNVALLVVYWAGDEDFPSSFQVLFDESAPHHLPTDACAILGSMLTGKLIKMKEIYLENSG